MIHAFYQVLQNSCVLGSAYQRFGVLRSLVSMMLCIGRFGVKASVVTSQDVLSWLDLLYLLT